MQNLISDKQKNSLMKNWGARAEAMDCFAEVKLSDLDGYCAFYIYAMNPCNPDEVMAIIHLVEAFTACCSLKEIALFHNSRGETLEIDREYRKKKANVILRELRGHNDTDRDY